MKQNERSGLLFALAGFAALSVGDIIVKSMAGMWPGPAIATFRYIVGAFGLGTILAIREGAPGFALPGLKWQVLRGFGVAISAMAFFSAVQLMPLAEATAIQFTSPMITALLAAAILREPARRSTWIASVVAFIGVLIVLRPNFAVLGVVALLPVLSAFGMGVLMIGNRAVAGRASALSMQFSVALIGMLFMGAFALAGHLSGLPMLHISVPHWSVLARAAFIACSASFAHTMIYLATTRAGAGTIAPMTYIQLLVAGLFGWFLFDEQPDLTALAGSAIIVAAGLYLWRSGKVVDEPQGTD